MAITYNSNIPLTNQSISSTTVPINDNFGSINTIIGVDHVPFDGPAGKEGYHKALHIVDGAVAGLVAGEGSLYVDSGNMFIKNGGSNAVNLTGAATDETAGDVTVRSYKLPNGLILRFGQTTGTKLTVSTSTTVAFPVAFTTCYSVNFSPIISGTSRTNNIYITSFNASGFTVYNRSGTSGVNADCTFYAIGI